MSNYHHRAVTDAIYAHKHRDRFDRQALVDKIVELAEWELFSNRQIAAFLGVSRMEVGKWSTKTDRTGGTLRPEALPYVLEVIELEERDEVNYGAVRRALDAGCSSIMLARLTGAPQSTLSRHGRLAPLQEAA